MKRYFTILFLFFIGISTAYAQSSLLKTDIWYDSEQQSTNQPQNRTLNKNTLQKTATIPEDSAVLLNFHSIQTFDTAAPFHADFDISKTSRLTVIVVFHSEDTLTEHGVWSVVRGGKQITGLTDKCLLRQKSEYQYPVKKRDIPLINTSMQAFSKIRGKANSNYFVLGEATLPDSSLSSFAGAIAECLVFDRFLSKKEALKIESYLAIKYGVTLIESDYLSSTDVVLWNYEENKEYSSGIAGIGKDSIFGLDQKQGCSSEEVDLLTISVGNLSSLNEDNSFVLPEANYLVWGHNGNDLTYNNLSCEEAYPLLERKWLIQTTYTDTAARFPTMVKLQLPEIYRDSSRKCYLIIDRSGTGDFTSGNVAYISQARMDEEGYVYFNNVVWDLDGSGKDMFTFSFGPVVEFVATPSCTNAPTGAVALHICGGQLPFDYVLTKDSTDQQFNYQGGRNYLFEALPAGQYILTVIDSNNSTITKTIEIPAFPAVASSFPSHYMVQEEDNIFDGEAYFGLSGMNYLWTKDSLFVSDSSRVDMSLPGYYNLTVTDTNGCIYIFNVLAEEPVLSQNHKRSSGKKTPEQLEQERTVPHYNVYPNPTTGHYKLEADLPEETPVFVRVYTTSGSLLEEWKDEGKKHYSFDSYLSTMGTYLIEIESIFGTEDFKVVVVK